MIERYSELTQTLVEVRAKLDAQLREHANTQRTQAERAKQEAAAARARIASDMRRFEDLLARASAAGLTVDNAHTPPTDFGGEPRKLFAQMIERLDEAISAAEHTQAALDAERQRQRQRNDARDQERQRRLAEEQRLMQEARRHDRLIAALALVCAAASLIVGISSGALIGLAVPAAGAAALSVAAVAWRSTIVPRLGRPWSTTPGAAYGSGAAPWVGSASAAALFCLYALASLASGFSAQRFGIGAVIAVACGVAQIFGRRQARQR